MTDTFDAERNYRLALDARLDGDTAAAAAHVTEAANAGHKPAVKLLAAWKVEGYLPFEDDDEAILLLEDAEKHGVDAASYQLAERFREGRGVQPDIKRAVALYTAAARNGHIASMLRLAECYEAGTGVKADPKIARRWRDKAAAPSIAEAPPSSSTPHQIS
jgi:hypothetical protein